MAVVEQTQLALCLVVVLLAAFSLARAAFGASRLYERPGPYSGAFRLYSGWIPGFHNDLSDIQWRDYRAALPQLIVALSLYVAASRAATRLRRPARANAVRIVVALALLCGLHGVYVFHVLAALSVHYVLLSRLAGVHWLGPVAAWVVPASIWTWARTTDGLPLAAISQHLAGLEAFRGPVRWHITLNLVLLRMISWAMDLHWQRTGVDVKRPAAADMTASKPAAREATRLRQRTPHSPDKYHLKNYLLYCCYPPLYLTGPTMTFNDFAHQQIEPRQTQVLALVSYAARILFSWLVLELLTHLFYINAMARFALWDRLPAAKSVQIYDGTTMAAVAFFKLVFLWLKFLVIWRVARFFALLDGVDPPENMLRCVCNNYNLSSFWRHWHASFNLWIVRYIYIPLGGSRCRMLNVWPIFVFVALWHDFEWHLLKWAWMVALCLVPEMACLSFVQTPCWRDSVPQAVALHLGAMVAAVYITAMMVVNLVGYGLHGDGLLELLQRIFRDVPLVCSMIGSFYCAVRMMFAIERKHAMG